MLVSDAELYANAPCGLARCLGNGTIERVNKTFCSWLGFAPEELVQLKRFQDLLSVGCKIFHQTHWLPLLQMQGSVAEVQLDFVDRGGQPLAMLVNAIKRSEQGVVYHDIAAFVATDRRKYERELLLARKRAEELLESERHAQSVLAQVHRDQEQDAKQRAMLAEQLVGIVSHDLRSPLHTIGLGVSLLGSTELTSPQSRTVARIASAQNRATRLIADLLDFTQARLGGGLRVNCRPIDLHAVVAECIEELRLASPGRMIEHLRSGEGMGSADPDRLTQVVTNLAVNALNYGAPEHPITIRSIVGERELCIEVHNEGRPIPAELLPHLFEPLRRGEQQVTLGLRSVGLGLYIVQEIANAHAGRVHVQSSAEAGTTFRVTIPSRAE